jgi:16S rRNA A1518/A1519 N6-dimethyltransferase RsmA/KsgA/DIM1 with predicted DNA glycosylase/AP lyase activity
VRERAREALVSLGHPPDERAERLSPEEFRELAARLGRS